MSEEGPVIVLPVLPSGPLWEVLLPWLLIGFVGLVIVLVLARWLSPLPTDDDLDPEARLVRLEQLLMDGRAIVDLMHKDMARWRHEERMALDRLEGPERRRHD